MPGATRSCEPPRVGTAGTASLPPGVRVLALSLRAVRVPPRYMVVPSTMIALAWMYGVDVDTSETPLA